MLRKLYQIVLVMVMVLMLAALASCSKEDNKQTSNKEADIEEDKDKALDNGNLYDVNNTVDNDSSKSDDNNTTDKPVEDDKTVVEDNDKTEDKEETPVITEAPTPTVTENIIPSEDDTLLDGLTLDGGIKDVYQQLGIAAGTCLSEPMIKESKYSDIINNNYTRITLENHLKPDYILNKNKSIETGDIVVEFSQSTIDLLDWAKNNNKLVRGHVLVWYSQTPDWIFYNEFDKTKGLVDRDTMLARMKSYIKQTFELLDTLGYTEIFYAYDVVNEAIMDNGTYRDCLWKKIIGDDYIWQAFYYADKYAPESIALYYNDFNEQFKTQHFIKLAKTLVDENGRYLIDGIGCQGHLYTKDSIDQYISTLKAFSALGLDVQITELDVSLGTWQSIAAATEENLKAQGQYYFELVSRIYKENTAGNTNVSGITFWGFADHLSWRNNRSPLLFDKDLNPKYAYHGAKLDRDNAGY